MGGHTNRGGRFKFGLVEAEMMYRFVCIVGVGVSIGNFSAYEKIYG